MIWVIPFVRERYVLLHQTQSLYLSLSNRVKNIWSDNVRQCDERKYGKEDWTTTQEWKKKDSERERGMTKIGILIIYFQVHPVSSYFFTHTSFVELFVE